MNQHQNVNRTLFIPLSFVLLYLVIAVGFGEACLCVEKPLHESFCDSDFVILAKVISKLKVMKSRKHLYEFRVETRKVFRQKKSLFHVGDIKTIFTPRSSDLCHARVVRGNFYLLGGNQKRHQFFVTSCGLTAPWTTIPRVTRKLIRKGRLSCECAVRGCNNQKCVKRRGSPKSQSCDHHSPIMQRCYSTYGICTLQGKNCRWSKRSRKSVKGCLTSTNSSSSTFKSLKG